METIHIALASDQRYFPGLLVTAVSIAAYAREDACLAFHILDGGLSNESQAYLKRRVCDNHAKSEIEFVGVNRETVDGLRSYHGSKMTYARMMLPESFPNLDFLVYCDVDFLWLADVAELWPLRDETKLCQGVHDTIMTDAAPEIAWLRTRGISMAARDYICGGLELLNLKAMRDEGIPRKLFAFLYEHPDNPQYDQTAINAVCAGRIGLLPPDWMRYGFLLEDGLPSSAVIHHATYGEVLFGLKKPHPFFIADDAVALWNRVYEKITGHRIRSYRWARLLFWIIRFARACGFSGVSFLRKPRAVFKQPDLGRFK